MYIGYISANFAVCNMFATRPLSRILLREDIWTHGRSHIVTAMPQNDTRLRCERNVRGCTSNPQKYVDM